MIVCGVGHWYITSKRPLSNSLRLRISVTIEICFLYHMTDIPWMDRHAVSEHQTARSSSYHHAGRKRVAPILHHDLDNICSLVQRHLQCGVDGLSPHRYSSSIGSWRCCRCPAVATTSRSVRNRARETHTREPVCLYGSALSRKDNTWACVSIRSCLALAALIIWPKILLCPRRLCTSRQSLIMATNINRHPWWRLIWVLGKV